MDLEKIIKYRKHPRDIIMEPLFTEKSGLLQESQNSYTFKVDRTANKIAIKHAVESIFSVNVKDVNTIKYRGKNKRMGRYTGKRPDWKKAVVTLEAGQTITGFEV